MSWRVKAYAAVWLVLFVAAATLIARRPDLDVLILRQPGTLQTTLDNGDVSNFYNLQILNRSNRAYTLTYRVVDPVGGSITALGPIGDVPPYGLVQSRFLLRLPARGISGTSTPVHVEVSDGGELVATVETSFLGIANEQEQGR